MDDRSPESPARWLFWILVFTVVTRLAVMLWVEQGNPRFTFSNDSARYDSNARALVHTGHFAAGPDQPDVPEVVRTPGYPAFLAVFYAVSGDRPWLALAAQILLSAATVGLVFLLGRRLFSPRAGLAGAVLLALDPGSFLYSQLLLSETLFTFFVVVAVMAAAAWTEKPSRAAGPDCRLCPGRGDLDPADHGLLHPAGGDAVPLPRAPPPLRLRLDGTGPDAAPAPLDRAGGGMAGSKLRGGRELPTQPDRRGQPPPLPGGGDRLPPDGIPMAEAEEGLRRQMAPFDSLPAREKYAEYRHRGLALVTGHPWLHLRLQMEGLAQTLLRPGAGVLQGYLNQRAYLEAPGVPRPQPLDRGLAAWVAGRAVTLAVRGFSGLFLIVLYGSAIAGLGRLGRHGRGRWMAHGFILLLAAYLLIVPAGPEAYPRFRVPVTPLLALYAGYGLLWMRKAGRRDDHAPRPGSTPVGPA